MAKHKDLLFVCKSCGNEFNKWVGQCSYCKEWNSLKEVSSKLSDISKGSGRRNVASLRSSAGKQAQPLKLSQIQIQTADRFSTGMEELDRVFGGSATPGVKNPQRPVLPNAGIVPGSVSLLSGQPGMGKSTLLSQLALNLSRSVSFRPSDEERGEEEKSHIQTSRKKISPPGRPDGHPGSQGRNDETGSHDRMTTLPKSVLYICGEESPQQVKLRLERLAGGGERHFDADIPNINSNSISDEKSPAKNNKTSPSKDFSSSPRSSSEGRNDHQLPITNYQLQLLPQTNCESLVDHILQHKDDYRLIIIDSIQSLTSEAVPGFAGSVSQVRECGFQLTQALKIAGIAGIIIGHVTKDGQLAGPKTLEHMVDAVLHIEGDRTHDLRLVRSVKNRFGTTDEVGVFRMTGSGLVEIHNASDVFLQEVQAGQPGSVVTAVLEGSRVILLEVQALVLKTQLPVPRRITNGIKINRLQMILAVLQKQLNLRLGEMDVFINVAGGVTIDEPGADLAIALAVISSMKDAPIGGLRIEKTEKLKNKKTMKQFNYVVFGELGLLGEIRPVLAADKRARTARQLGYTHIIGPENKKITDLINLFK